WAAAQMGPEASAAYNQSFAMRLRGAFSIESRRAALDQLTARHEALRVTYGKTGGHQVVAASSAIPMTVTDASDWPSPVRERAVAAVLDRECREPFDLAAGPLARVHIVRESEHEHVFVFTAHHLVCDGWSSGILLRDLAACYDADRYGVPARLAETARYGDCVRAAG